MLKRSALLACLLSTTGALGAPLPKELYKDLTPGPYLIKIKGMLTHACGRAIQAEFSRHPMITKAEADFEQQTVVITVKANGRLSIAELKGILKRASKRMRLSVYEVDDIRYMPSGR
ncbi:MAG: heavy-metal-associated domain-containing protein [Elusimicrobia bacterium]|nr:heavy-metal-associated domain-containing protein [Elusimicrobiota bacterium]